MSFRRLIILLSMLIGLMSCAGCAERDIVRSDNREVRMEVLQFKESTTAIVPVHFGDKGPYRFVLDTGSSISVIDMQLARELRLKFTGRAEPVIGITKQTNARIAQVDRWRLGEIPLKAGTVATLDLPGDGSRLSGLLGSDRLSDFGRVTLDYEHERLTVGTRTTPTG